MYAIETENLSKSYDDHPGLRGITLRISTGEVYGLLGANGAGKTTLLHLLMGFLKPSGGKIRLLGTGKLDNARARIGYLSAQASYHSHFSTRAYLRFLGQFSDMDGTLLQTRIDEELERVGLTDVANQRIASFSKSMLQRLGIAQALLHKPDILLIDEPTSGQEPAGQNEILELLTRIRSTGCTILITTHYLDEIEYLCDRVGILVDGRLASETDVARLRAPGRSIAIQVDHISDELRVRLEQISPAIQCGEYTIILRPNNQTLQAAVLRILLDEGVAILSLEQLERPLERLYLQAVRGDAAELLESHPLPPLDDVEVDRTSVQRRSEGDTLLNELLQRDGQPRSPDDASSQQQVSTED